jgi:hypothetical protein
MSQSGWLGRISLSPPTHSQGSTCPLYFSLFLFFPFFSFFLPLSLTPDSAPPLSFSSHPNPSLPSSPLLLSRTSSPSSPFHSPLPSPFLLPRAEKPERTRERERPSVIEKNLRVRKMDSWLWVERFWSWVVGTPLWHGGSNWTVSFYPRVNP